MVSERASIEFLAPEGIDKEAFAAATKAMYEAKFATGSCEPHAIPEWFLKAPSFLGRFPASTYAAYVIHGRMAGFMEWGVNTEGGRNIFLRSLETGAYFSDSYPDETGRSKDGWQWLKGKEAADWWAKWYDIILKNHPDIWFADELRLKRAVDQLALKNYQTGAADLGTLSKQAKPDVAQKAKQLLEAIKQKGWVKS
jgi:hypothetical protein